MDYLGVNPLTFYPRRNVKILIKGNILVLSLKQHYLPHLIEHQTRIFQLSSIKITHKVHTFSSILLIHTPSEISLSPKNL
jgi:hypothetical protein